jgi:hypothetical protein
MQRTEEGSKDAAHGPLRQQQFTYPAPVQQSGAQAAGQREGGAQVVDVRSAQSQRS